VRLYTRSYYAIELDVSVAQKLLKFRIDAFSHEQWASARVSGLRYIRYI